MELHFLFQKEAIFNAVYLYCILEHLVGIESETEQNESVSAKTLTSISMKYVPIVNCVVADTCKNAFMIIN